MTLQWIWLHLVIGRPPFPGWARVFMPCCSLPQAGSGTILAAASVKNGLTDFLSSMAASADVLALAKIEVCCQKLLSWVPVHALSGCRLLCLTAADAMTAAL
jgi:hypothetical protein